MRLEGFVEKGWGRENIWVTTDKYCGKLLEFKSGKQFSMHFHAEKEETWYVLKGKFIVYTINTQNAEKLEHFLEEGNVWHNAPLVPHQIVALTDGIIMEVSTPDSVEDNYRVMPGDSQKFQC